ncbi:hypothetical protein [Couchioplanes caeruleus]|uniref:Uncharacterized protein n=2 Tax=Couchioplanes caeruleus TaxID=56438 RepID=A0A1K0FXM6_9ACTN|nr:hypothetical protein [Couchioplanes caeruleus]OJF09834.1 hypothetical protein BG844_35320 [Couchioplanes caeruleus subsp. caeruleus]ROP29713.1 hypothetical protein EDD30_2525 [Couchioplanes caeruleus]
MYLTWADIAQTLLAGLAGMLGVFLVEEGLRVLRERGLSPARWAQNRTFLTPRARAVQAVSEADTP